MPVDAKTRDHTWFTLYAALKENPRATVKELFCVMKQVQNWKRIRSAQVAVDKAFRDRIVVGPYLYCNCGVEVTLFEEEVDTEELEGTGVSLAGNYSYLLISEGRNVVYAELVKPSFPAKIVLEGGITDDERKWIDTWFDVPEELDPDVPPVWDDTEWDIYEAMRNPRQSFFEIGKRLQIPWRIVKERFQRIVKDCKVFVGFFPLGYPQYDHLLITLRTEYETGIRKFLAGLDRSTWLLKVDDTLVLYLFHTHINLTCLKFCEMINMGIIEDVKVGIPIDSEEGRFFLFDL
jgi:hypothetical protein